MTFDLFTELEAHGSTITVHNVRLVDVQPGQSDQALMTVEHAGTRRVLPVIGAWNADYSRRDVGKFGYLVPVHPMSRAIGSGFCAFRAYEDQSLRRVPDMDAAKDAVSDSGRAENVVGWVCSARPFGFRAPIGIIPGEGGGFVPDETEAVTLRLPPEFIRECKRVQMSPEELLRSFVGDLAGIQNYVSRPRADRYGSNGSDERMYAENWLERAHGMNAVDLFVVEAREQDEADQEVKRQDFGSLLDEFENYGGKAEDLHAAVEALVNEQAKKSPD